MNIIHIRADGSTQQSIDGVVIQNEQFYQVANGIIENRKKVLYEARQKTNV